MNSGNQYFANATKNKTRWLFKFLLLLTFIWQSSICMAALDINKATVAELDGIQGIGPATSKRIMQEREKSEFKDWQDFMKRVKGIKAKKAAQLSAQGVTVNGKGL